MKFIFVRHGLSTNNLENQPDKRIGEHELTDTGKRQAEALGAYYFHGSETMPTVGIQYVYDALHAVDRCYTSPNFRAIQTAERLRHYAGEKLPFVLHPSVFEWGGLVELAGAHSDKKAPGMTQAEMKAYFKTLSFATPDLVKNGWWHQPEKEQPKAVWQRCQHVLQQLFATPRSCTLIVSHLWFINVFRRQLLGLPYVEGWWDTDIRHIDHTGICIFEMNDTDVVKQVWNAKHHL